MGRPAGSVKMHCKHGHNIKRVGRAVNGSCAECHRIRNREWRARQPKVTDPKQGGRPQARYCQHGHDTAEVGRTSVGVCRKCQNLRSRASHLRAIYDGELPVLRLKQYVRRRFSIKRDDQAAMREVLAISWARYRGINEESAEKMVRRLLAKESLAFNRADEWACALDSHLVLIWPETYPPGETFKDEEVA